MGAKAKVVAAAAVLAAAVIVLRPTERARAPALDDPGPTPAVLAAARGPEGDTGPAPRGAAPAAEGRREVGAAAAAELDDLGALVYGTVLGAQGEPVAEGTIDLVDAHGRATRGSIGVPGSWSALGLSPGDYQIAIASQGFVDTSSSLAIPAAARELRHDLRLDEALSIPVRFTDEAGAPLKLHGFGRVQPVVVATREPPPVSLPGVDRTNLRSYGCATYEGRSDRFQPVPGLALHQSGLLHLRAAPPMWVSAVLRDQVLETRRLEGPVEELVFRISDERAQGLLSTVRLRVIDSASGEPVEGARVSLQYGDSGGLGGHPLGADGRAELLKQPPGLQVLQVMANGYALLRRTVRVAPGSDFDLGDIALRASVAIAGMVVDERGQPVATSLTYLELDDGNALLGDSDASARSALDGSFRIDCGRGRILLRAAGGDWACEPVVVDASSALEGVVLQVRRGTEVRFRSRGDPAPGACFIVATENGLPFLSRPVSARIPEAVRLSAGRYQLWVGQDEEVRERTSFEVPSDAAEEGLLLDLPALRPAR
jgi:protocatechuate 3,4-dioxygenase beta subunit